jgi:hypothetical protein
MSSYTQYWTLKGKGPIDVPSNYEIRKNPDGSYCLYRISNSSSSSSSTTCEGEKVLVSKPYSLMYPSFLHYNNTRLNELRVCFPHNAATNASVTALGRELIGRNQNMSISEYISYLPYTPILGIDIDMAKCSGGSLSGAHGAQRLGGIGGLCDASNADLKITFRSLFDAVKAAPHSILIIRSENNNGINEDDILQLVDALDIITPFGRPHRDLLFPMTKGSMPTYGDVIASGKRVLIFLEKDEHPTIKPNYETGLYPRGFVMTQKCFFARTKWNKANELMNRTKSIESNLVTEDIIHLPPSNFFIMIDYYTTILGAKYSDIVTLHTNIFIKIDIIFQRICTYLSNMTPSKTPPTGYMFMVDMISPEIIAICIDQNELLVRGINSIYNRYKTATKNRAIYTNPTTAPFLNSGISSISSFFRSSSASSSASPTPAVPTKKIESLNALHKGWKLRPLKSNISHMENVLSPSPPEIQEAGQYIKDTPSITPVIRKQLETKIADYYKTKDEARLKNIRDQLKIFKKTRRNSRNKMRKTMRRFR